MNLTKKISKTNHKEKAQCTLVKEEIPIYTKQEIQDVTKRDPLSLSQKKINEVAIEEDKTLFFQFQTETNSGHPTKEEKIEIEASENSLNKQQVISNLKTHHNIDISNKNKSTKLEIKQSQNHTPPANELAKFQEESTNSAPSPLTSNRRKHSLKFDEVASITPKVFCNVPYNISTDLLDEEEQVYPYNNPEEIKKIITILEETLQQFNVDGKVVGIQRGPIITRFELKIAPGIKVSKILSLTDELAMALEALRVRIEAPIPGRSTVGVEIPNKKRIKVLLGGILRAESFQDFDGKLPLPIGKDIAGNLVIADLTKLPHLLIAGATGAGKSVSINSFIINFIINKTPKEIRFIMIDPKLVELSQYNDIPHLLHPVITDSKKSIAALNWAVEEMERRYEDLAEVRVRDINSYNDKIQESSLSEDEISKLHMPYIIILVDELGDLMMIAGKEVESSIIRLSQKARAVGIHLILATQRPSVDVITALIKANCPARIALQVAQKTDSRTILDSNGAEQLLGQGDSLFKHPTQGQLIRVQAPLIKDSEVERVVDTVIHFAKPNYIILEDEKEKGSKLGVEEERLFKESWEIILESGKASASYLQRRLRIGYNKAARLIEAFEARGYVGPQIGSKPREILIP